ncbi:MAG: hypothetical protein A2750_03240 [Candidatus Yanofskybacteria bacterium RIFCSPHIGHO2_01_FULL_45_42]|uniref:UPF0235 protein A3J47_02580 n=2 Tax=Candidatus Yanofskyibacteriota TaxID=1752733 RepID=A0A1F8FTP5_9BACT|nr:MAG: hypothetical protein A2750_03240 [Candidatus Yanofskybacteria bacterium RIFCSPHIGHO2_01_FULL_45_42]OGN15826.1 MAG: hypothetical protein A3J47_02580 [Candidatus Yanofskybacteria bacterium RIFCSPHIGHO2_02_FULL_43_22]OGN28120.1 MAG: hypothetical protein A3B17_00430 [Candidatus Yanofskybacteria bacterium RIFCSPLOWO2_01_FULL_45_72]
MRFQVKATPNSNRPEVTQEGDTLKVKIDAPPVKGMANRRLVELLSRHFKVPPSHIKIISGHTSRNKIVEVLGK